MRNLRLILRLGRLAGVLLYGVLLALLACALEPLTRDRLALRQRLCRQFLAALAACLPFRLRVHGNLPTEPMLWVANHVSWTDIPLIGRLAPLSFLSKAEVRQWPLCGWLAEQGGTLFIRRGAGDSNALAERIGKYLAEGHPLLLFPEGTTGDGAHLRPFHGRLLTAAITSGLSVQPVAIAYRRNGRRCTLAPFIDDDELPTHLMRLLRADVCEVTITLLPPIAAVGMERSALARQARASILAALDVDAFTQPVAA